MKTLVQVCLRFQWPILVYFSISISDRSVGTKAADILLSSRHLIAMSSVPGLCSICCICLEYLLQEDNNAESIQMLDKRGVKAEKNTGETNGKEVQIPGEEAEDSRRESQGKNGEQSGKREGDEGMKIDDTNCTAQLSSTVAQVPTTRSQVYLTVVAAFLSRYDSQRRRDCKPKTTVFPKR